jgi:uncharacterized damage-inducible protein DinB
MTAVACEPVPQSPDRVGRLPAVPPLVAVLQQLADLVGSMTDEQYARKPVGVVPSSVGGHVRHNLDHVEAVLAGLDGGLIDYDRRRRGTPVEGCRRAALEAIRRMERQLLALPDRPGRLLLRLSVLLTPDGPPAEVTTTLGRELAFALSHTIHHNSLIAVMAKLMGVPVPADFGYAPATIAHREARTCAR